MFISKSVDDIVHSPKFNATSLIVIVSTVFAFITGNCVQICESIDYTMNFLCGFPEPEVVFFGVP